VAIRSSKSSASAPAAADVPVTGVMLGKVRTEVLQRIDQAREEARADNQRLDAKIDAVRAELKADLHEVKAGMHGMQAQMARIEVLVEEQNARNKIVLDGITALLSRQNQVEERVTQVEDTVRKLAAVHPHG
jgi:septal ring factor EnvC (AmiA/AmiB activator)